MRIYDAPSELAGKWIREVDHLAALRRAKAEGVRLVQKEMEESGNQRLGGWINWCHARAAQIEEGE